MSNKQETEVVFIIGTGRSGTRSMFKMLSGTPDVEVHHEFVCTQVQKLAVEFSLGLVDKEEAKRQLHGLHFSGVYWSQAKLWIDCSNKLTWLIAPLIEIFPAAKFVNLVRDGRKVANSFVRKLGDEMYDDESVAVMTAWLSNRDTFPTPPPEKKYWWNIPQGSMPMANQFDQFDQFERAVYHWVEANRVARESLSRVVPQTQQLTLKLEDLTADRAVLARLCEFIGVPDDDSYWGALQRPENVIFPMDARLTKQQEIQFKNLAAGTMKYLGYDILSTEYSVDYK